MPNTIKIYSFIIHLFKELFITNPLPDLEFLMDDKVVESDTVTEIMCIGIRL